MTPAPVRWAGYLVAAEGAVAVVVALIYLFHVVTGSNQDVVRGLPGAGAFSYGTAAWFAIMGAAVAAAGWALTTGRRWGRGIAVFANLLLLGVAYYIYGAGQTVYAALVVVAALVALGLLFSPAAVHWMASRD
ncbi:MAG TPA: hypothetical protein VFW21_15940 [Mycobacterium sp.]|nr:hypothetical protein [Mycobacterium sp.]